MILNTSSTLNIVFLSQFSALTIDIVQWSSYCNEFEKIKNLKKKKEDNNFLVFLIITAPKIYATKCKIRDHQFIYKMPAILSFGLLQLLQPCSECATGLGVPWGHYTSEFAFKILSFPVLILSVRIRKWLDGLKSDSVQWTVTRQVSSLAKMYTQPMKISSSNNKIRVTFLPTSNC